MAHLYHAQPTQTTRPYGYSQYNQPQPPDQPSTSSAAMPLGTQQSLPYCDPNHYASTSTVQSHPFYQQPYEFQHTHAPYEYPAQLASRPLPRPLPQPQNPPQSIHTFDRGPPPPVPDQASRPPARYFSSNQPTRPEHAPYGRPLPPDPVAQSSPKPQPATPQRQATRSSPVITPSIAVHDTDDALPTIAIEPGDAESENRNQAGAPVVPSFTISEPEQHAEEEQSPSKQSAPPPNFSVNVAPPSPPKLKAVSTAPQVSELGQSQKGLPQSTSSTSIDQLNDSVTTLSLSQQMVCAGCGMPIGGRIVSAMKRRWHPDCFKCDACGEGLEHVAFYEEQGKPYCHVDYHERFSIRCHHCKTPIESETYVTLDDPALGLRYYHELHFFCAECGDPFIDPKSLNRESDEAHEAAILAKPFVVRDGWPYCENCNVQLHKPKCANCKLPIQDEEVLNAMGKSWHEDCFVCHACQQPFEDSFLLRKGNPYCEHCYKVALRSDV